MRSGRAKLVVALLLLATAWLYAPSLHFGLMWDDPQWFGRASGRGLAELLGPMPDFHFYRPLVMLYNSLFVHGDGRLAVFPLHAAQIGWHLLNVALTYSLGRALRLGPAAATIAAGLMAFHPFAYQAVAWAAPQQAMNVALLSGAWLAYLAARRRQRRWRPAALSLLLFASALLLQESSVLLSLTPLLLELHGSNSRRWREWRDGRWLASQQLANQRLALTYPVLGAVFALIWLMAPRQQGYTVLAVDVNVSAYLLQGIVFPLVGRPWGYTAAEAMSTGLLLLLSVFVILLLLGLAWRGGHGRTALFGLSWALLGLLLPVGGLSYDYVSIGPRLFYYAIPGISIVWACALWSQAGPWGAVTGRQLAQGFLVVAIIVQSVWILQLFNRLYSDGTTLIQTLVDSVAAEDERLVFINFPDRYALKRPPYPLGYWGVTLAPIVTDLGAFPASLTGARVQTMSVSMPWLNEQEREAGPYHVDMRGVITPPEQLYILAQEATAVYLSVYHPDGRFTLLRLGQIVTGIEPPLSCGLAWFDNRLCLQTAVVVQEDHSLRLLLSWWLAQPAEPHETIFAHLGQVGQTPIAQADGGPWLNALPLSVWQPGDLVQEQRLIDLPQTAAPGDYLIRVGFYNWVTAERYPLLTPAGKLLPGDAAVIGRFP
jgi:hypothetical protein